MCKNNNRLISDEQKILQTISLQDYVKRLWNHSNTKIPITIGKGTDTAKPRSKAPHAGQWPVWWLHRTTVDLMYPIDLRYFQSHTCNSSDLRYTGLWPVWWLHRTTVDLMYPSEEICGSYIILVTILPCFMMRLWWNNKMMFDFICTFLAVVHTLLKPAWQLLQLLSRNHCPNFVMYLPAKLSVYSKS